MTVASHSWPTPSRSSTPNGLRSTRRPPRPEPPCILTRGRPASTHAARAQSFPVELIDPGADRFADVTLSADLSRLVRVPVDVRVANSAPVAFLFHMLRGRILTVRDERLLADVMERTARQYHDQAPLVRRATREAFAA